MKRKCLLIDVDEVLGNLQTPIFEIVYRLFGKKMTPYDYEGWDLLGTFSESEQRGIFKEMRKPGFCSSIRPTPGSVEAINELRKHVDVYPVTSPLHSRTWVSERYDWLHRHFDFDRKAVVFTWSKFLIVGDAFLDDNPDHVTSWLEAHPGKLGMLWHLPNTRTLTEYDNVRVKSWDVVIEKVRAL
jgi:5'-nucleotidase